VLFAAIKGYTDSLLTSELQKFEKLFIEHMKTKHNHVLKAIKHEKILSGKTETELRQIVQDLVSSCGLKTKS